MIRTGSVVRSTAGRDREKLLLVVGVTEAGVLVCDGKERPLERPKRKNPRHLAYVGDGQEILKAAVGNKALRRALAAFAAGQTSAG